MKKLALHKVVTLVAAVVLGSAGIANDAFARGGGYGGGGYGGHGYGGGQLGGYPGYYGGQLGGYPGYYDGSGQDFGAYVEPPSSGYYAEGKQDFDEDEYVEPTYPGLYGFYPSYRPYSSTR
jgi:hypothetical protein